MGGTKHDTDKLRMDLIPKEALDGMAAVLGFGAKKYDDHNWRKGIKHNRLYAACLRHLTAYWNGETFDPESGRNHLEHAMTNIAFMLASPDYDDRYKKDSDRCLNNLYKSKTEQRLVMKERLRIRKLQKRQ